MDLLLTHGYLLSEDLQEQRIMRPYPPLGLLSLHAYLKQHGFDTAVHDPTFHTWAELIHVLETMRPKAVGIYCTLMTKRTVLRMIEQCKRMGAKVVLGGPEPSVYAEEFLRHGADIVVFGEGEQTLQELLPVIHQPGRDGLKLIAGIAFLDEAGTFVRTGPRTLIQDLNTLPWPDREAIDLQPYLDTWKTHHGKSSMSVITARGCPYTCTWCSHGVYGYTHRRRSPESVVGEIRALKQRYDPDMLWIADDVFTINHGWLRTYRDLMVAEKLVTPFECITRADRLSEEILDLLRDLGCFRVWIGSESGSDDVLRAMSRGVDTRMIGEMTKAAQVRGIEVGLFIMLGYDGETMDDIDRTIEHLKQTEADSFLTTIAYPLKGTPFYERVSTRIRRPGSWLETTDRDLKIHGRYSDLFYWFALRRLTNEVEYARRTRIGAGSLTDRITLKSKSLLSRLGMRMSSLSRS